MLTLMKSMYSSETIDSLTRLPPVDPAKYGRRWRPVSHVELASRMVNAAQEQYGSVGNLNLLLSPDAQSLIGTFDLSSLQTDDSYVPTALFRHDNKQGRALLIGAGGQVFICENGILSCLWSVKTKHERHVDFGQWIADAVRAIGPAVAAQARNVSDLQDNYMPNPAGAFFELHRTDGLPRSLSFASYEEWLNPRHTEFAGSDRWSWYNSVTQAAKDLAPTTQVQALELAFARASRN